MTNVQVTIWLNSIVEINKNREHLLETIMFYLHLYGEKKLVRCDTHWLNSFYVL